ncbi:MAG: bifunctional (p)ppGpp synthetase/guanosine-3',5'-bis(diphosphate) 3'-pyrophosphohydrolase [Flavobacteriales bacterium]|nr:bifunctional (p)ppGpp synthetase/guanosine-3',5'-bis(diphosphate) 3'-pyrophosphohydrolase [Flavobacteriales bacterium]
MQVIDREQEKKEILNKYRALLRDCRRSVTRHDKQQIRKAFNTAMEAHMDMRRKSGEPYIFHPLAVARIAAGEIGLGTTSVVAALLHDVVEDTEITLDDIRRLFSGKVARIIDGLTKISGVTGNSSSMQAENFRKMLLTLSDDVRVILIKLADRLHNMRTLESLDRKKQLKIASETLYLYAPLAHRLGLNAIKTELEDLGLKYTEPEVYNSIEQKLIETQKERNRFINRFITKLKKPLDEQQLKYSIKGRPKSVFSIWSKMKKKGIPFEEVYDIFAIRIILDSQEDQEKADCWRAYSVVTDYYHPNPDRLRDWISTPKANGYESLHTTVMGPEGKWVEVQIRTVRMDEIAEKGYAAHWKYKDSVSEHALEEWIRKIREMLENPEPNALDFIDDFKLNLFADEIFVFTPRGELKTLPSGATALDFAFDIHTDVGSACLGAKVNHKLVPLSHTLRSGDQVEIITSSKQKPKDEWLNYVVTAKAKSKIKNVLKEEKRKVAEEGKTQLRKKLESMGLEPSTGNISELQHHFRVTSSLELYYRIAMNAINLKDLKKFKVMNGQLHSPSKSGKGTKTLEEIVAEARGKSGMLVIGDQMDKIEYKLSPCCNPIPGDDVFGFVTINEGIKIHRTNCPNAIELMSNYAYRIVKARWMGQESIAFLAGIRITGIDEVGLVNNLTRVISDQHNVNMRSISFDTMDGTFEGTVMVYVHDTDHLTSLINQLKKVHGVHSVDRIS